MPRKPIEIHDLRGVAYTLTDLAALHPDLTPACLYHRYRKFGDNYARVTAPRSAPAPARASLHVDLTPEERRLMNNRWRGMIRRCTNPNDAGYHNYGGRGIRVCEEWLGFPEGFQNFVHYVGRPPFARAELDRIDNDGNYEPGNVRWVSKRDNDNNRRTNTWCWIDTPQGRKKMTLAQAARFAGLDQTVVKSRYARGDRGNELVRPARSRSKTPRRTGGSTKDERLAEIAQRYGEDYHALYCAFARLGFDYDKLLEREERRHGTTAQDS